MNCGALPMTPWEEALFEKGKVPGVRTACQIPPILLARAANVRDAAMKHIKPTDVTLADMKRALSPHLKKFYKLDPMFLLEYTFLTESAPVMASEQVRGALMACLPNEKTVNPSIPQVVLVQRGSLFGLTLLSSEKGRQWTCKGMELYVFLMEPLIALGG